MSNFFMYGSELQELEQLMMLVPNFLPRKSGVIVVQRIRNEEVPSGFERDYEHITAYCSSNGSRSFTNQIAGGYINYEEIVCSCFEKCESYHLNVRLGDLIRSHDGELFDSKMELVLTMLSSIAQEESRNISENSKWGIKKRFKDGVAIVNCERFLGYNKDENGHLVINEEEAKIVKRIYREYLDGKGYAAIARGLTRDQIPTAAGKPKWWDSTVSGILLNEKYMGTLLLQKTVTIDYLTHKRVDNRNMEPQYIVENNHEAIITPEMWDMVQKERERRFAISAGKNTDKTNILLHTDLAES